MSTEINPTTGMRLDIFGPTLEFLERCRLGRDRRSQL